MNRSTQKTEKTTQKHWTSPPPPTTATTTTIRKQINRFELKRNTLAKVPRCGRTLNDALPFLPHPIHLVCRLNTKSIHPFTIWTMASIPVNGNERHTCDLSLARARSCKKIPTSNARRVCIWIVHYKTPNGTIKIKRKTRTESKARKIQFKFIYILFGVCVCWMQFCGVQCVCSVHESDGSLAKCCAVHFSVCVFQWSRSTKIAHSMQLSVHQRSKYAIHCTLHIYMRIFIALHVAPNDESKGIK